MAKPRKGGEKKIEEELPPLPPSFFGFMEAGDASELSQVLNSFFSSDKNMDLKTELHNPRAVAILDVLIHYLDTIGLGPLADCWRVFRKAYVDCMVSYKRGGRAEMVEILKEFKEEMKDREVAWD